MVAGTTKRFLTEVGSIASSIGISFKRTSYTEWVMALRSTPRPGRGVSLGIEIDDQDTLTLKGQCRGEVDGSGGLADSPFLIGQGDDCGGRGVGRRRARECSLSPHHKESRAVVKDPGRNHQFFVPGYRNSRSAHHRQAARGQNSTEVGQKRTGGHSGPANNRFNRSLEARNRCNPGVDFDINHPGCPSDQVNLPGRPVNQGESAAWPEDGEDQSGQAGSGPEIPTPLGGRLPSRRKNNRVGQVAIIDPRALPGPNTASRECLNPQPLPEICRVGLPARGSNRSRQTPGWPPAQDSRET